MLSLCTAKVRARARPPPGLAGLHIFLKNSTHQKFHFWWFFFTFFVASLLRDGRDPHLILMPDVWSTAESHWQRRVAALIASVAEPESRITLKDPRFENVANFI